MRKVFKAGTGICVVLIFAFNIVCCLLFSGDDSFFVRKVEFISK
jgi:hypothetical protein